MYQAIEVKYYGPTTYRGERFRVRTHGKTKWFAHVYRGKNMQDSILHVAELMAAMMGWKGNYYGGVIRDGTHVFVVSNGKEKPLFIVTHTDIERVKDGT
jgi:hypothetical protein